MQLSENDRDLIIRTIIGEASAEPEVGQRGVASVILNRLHSGRFGKTGSEVVMAKNQFEPWSARRAELLAIDPKSKSYQAAQAALDAAEKGDDPTGGATHFYAPDLQRKLGRNIPNWAQGEGLPIGRHTFFAPEGKVTRVAGNVEGEDLLRAFMPQSAPVKKAPDDGEDLLRAFMPVAKPVAAPKETATPPVAAANGEETPGQRAARLGPTNEGYTVGDLAKSSVAQGLLRGVRDTAVTVLGGAERGAASGAEALAARGLLPKSFAERLRSEATEMAASDQKKMSDFERDYGDSTVASVSRVGGQILGAAPLMAVGGGAVAPVANRLLGTTATRFLAGQHVGSGTARVLSGTSRGAIEGAGTAGLVSSAYDEPIGNQVLTGAVIGGPVGGLMRGAGNILLGSKPMAAETAELAAKARDKFGIDLHPGQISTAPAYRFLDSVVNSLPFSGGAKAYAGQQAAFNRGVASTFGETAERVTPEVMDAARARIGKVFDDVAAATPDLRLDQKFGTAVVGMLDDARQVLQASEVTPLKKQVAAIVEKFRDGKGAISGDAYQALTRKGAPLDRLMNSTDPNIKFYAGHLRDALDDLMERNAPSEALQKLTNARREWRALKTVEPLAAKSSDGNISPAALLTEARKGYNMARGGQGDLTELARIGQRFLKPPASSGTAERLTVTNALLGTRDLLTGGLGLSIPAAAGAGGAMLTGGVAPIAGAIGYGVAAPLIGKAVRSKALSNKLIDRGLGKEARFRPVPTQAAGALSVPAYNQFLRAD